MGFEHLIFVCGCSEDQVDGVANCPTWVEYFTKLLEDPCLSPEVAGGRNLGGEILPKKMGQILSATSNEMTDGVVPETLSQMLARCRFLIVLCSPNTVRSQRVDATVRAFRSNRRDAEIVAVVIAGQPAESLCPALRCDPPRLTVDFRNVSRRKLAMEQLFTTVLGLDVGTLVQRRTGHRWRSGVILSATRADAATMAASAAADSVTFKAYAPSAIAPGQSFVLDIWAHTFAQAKSVEAQAQSLGREHKVGIKAPVSVARDTILGIVIEIRTLHIADPTDSILWYGKPSNASFIVEVPASAAPGAHPGRALISAAGIPIAKLAFAVTVEERASETPARIPLRAAGTAPATAFASYSSHDRAEVLARVQGMKKVCPQLDVFLDVISLRSGQDWSEKIREHVPSKDVFFLFWSEHAAKSKEVEKEWQLALDTRGIEYIDPVPLTDPKDTPPPKRLSKLHFNDFYLAYIKLGEAFQKSPASHPRPWKFR
jgi:hypothetical protein